MMIEMHICTYVNLYQTWRQQLMPVMGGDEVEKLNTKLKEMNVPNIDSVNVYYSLVVGNPPRHLHARFHELIRDIGTWPTVSFCFNFILYSSCLRMIVSLCCCPCYCCLTLTC